MLTLFHYHWWTTDVERVERFYREYGFQVTLRTGKHSGELKLYNPPLEWDDFRNETNQFRIVELRQGKVNITMGTGTKEIFDHIGFLVDEVTYASILERANALGFRLNIGDRRTFISTPWRIRLELQKRSDAVMDSSDFQIARLDVTLPEACDFEPLATLLGTTIRVNEATQATTLLGIDWELQITPGPQANLTNVVFKDD